MYLIKEFYTKEEVLDSAKTLDARLKKSGFDEEVGIDTLDIFQEFLRLTPIHENILSEQLEVPIEILYVSAKKVISDCQYIIDVMEKRGYELTKTMARNLWHQYSLNNGDGWLMVTSFPEKNIFKIINSLAYLEGVSPEDTGVWYIPKKESNKKE